jgi:hypothetical protein
MNNQEAMNNPMDNNRGKNPPPASWPRGPSGGIQAPQPQPAAPLPNTPVPAPATPTGVPFPGKAR